MRTLTIGRLAVVYVVCSVSTVGSVLYVVTKIEGALIINAERCSNPSFNSNYYNRVYSGESLILSIVASSRAFN